MWANQKMNLDGFREPQSPWFFTQPSQYLVETNVRNAAAPPKDTAPTPDARFKGWAAPMADGRIATDYRAHCEVNQPTGTQFASRQFMQHNAEALMKLSRRRQAERAGAGLPYDSRTEAPAAAYVKCNSVECAYTVGNPGGIGVERIEETPELFGTFAMSHAAWKTPVAPKITTVYEGGRNTVRGFY